MQYETGINADSDYLREYGFARPKLKREIGWISPRRTLVFSSAGKV